MEQKNVLLIVGRVELICRECLNSKYLLIFISLEHILIVKNVLAKKGAFGDLSKIEIGLLREVCARSC